MDSPVVPTPIPAELAELQAVLALGASCAGETGFAAEIVARASARGAGWPVWAITLGNPDRSLPAVGFFGGVHGLERIGSDVALAWLRHLLARLPWDRSLRELLDRTRVVVMPLVNPGGLLLGTRANPNGVDLMRNAPVEAEPRAMRLIGGHRWGPHLPWFRGEPDAPMEAESAALCALVERELAGRPLSIAIDCHSGFGMRDRIWIPHACTRVPARVLPELHALATLFEQSHPCHPYRFEPQSAQYLTHGDLWDFLHRRIDTPETPFLPMTLEMGSWLWVRKNMRQVFSRTGIFNPRPGHRHRRVLRAHLPWFDFLLRAAASYPAWLPMESAARGLHQRAAMTRWYGEHP